ncbi:sigma-E factor negative regulatory protein [Noviherbaspirillum sp. UKPF54]|uniref:sigma-E factor negative regulatory protein n=1 Tax=Noviherbaspirillum sp. UKPF54 TaxID=2601898 RepID=UPI001FEEEFEE|nr:sigma-E factor negative regulatory protein [Noviherbaspirillum sp. UKPF54]
MKMNEMTGERISAFADAEYNDSQVDLVLATLRHPEGKAAWDIYHQIGDVLRSDDMAVSLSPGFAARMAARLDAEPTIIAPMDGQKQHADDIDVAQVAAKARTARRWAIPGAIAAAAAAAAAFFVTPQMMLALNGKTTEAGPSSAVASAGFSGKTAVLPADMEQGGVITASAPDGVVLRDSRIDDYLLAHQRFSPSVFSTAQYARSATFANDSNK